MAVERTVSEWRMTETSRQAIRFRKFHGADLKRLVEDGKAIYAYDKAKRVDLKEPTDYFLKAVAGVRENKLRYAEAQKILLMRRKGAKAKTTDEHRWTRGDQTSVPPGEAGSISLVSASAMV